MEKVAIDIPPLRPLPWHEEARELYATGKYGQGRVAQILCERGYSVTRDQVKYVVSAKVRQSQAIRNRRDGHMPRAAEIMPDVLLSAIKKVDGGMTIAQAAREEGVDETALGDRIRTWRRNLPKSGKSATTPRAQVEARP